MAELTDSQVEKCNTINGVAYRAMCDVLGEELKWDMEWIGELSDAITSVAIDYFGKTEMEVYPYMEE